MSLFGERRHAPLPAEGYLPGFDGATGWLNTQPLTAEGLRGKVVLVDFWTYTCINWLRTLAYVRAWAERYKDRGLVVVGVHTPEFPFERNVDNVRRAANDMNVWFPVALDPDYAVWRAFSNRYWPAIYIADVQGRIRHHQFGEGGYDECERGIQQLLHEAGADGVPDGPVSPTPEGFEAQADWTNLRSPETYLGYAQGQNFASGGGAEIGVASAYAAPEMLMLNQWALAGDWTIESGTSSLNAPDGRIAFRFHARDVHLVLRSREETRVPFRVLLDGAPPGAAHGLDVDEDGEGTLVQPRVHIRLVVVVDEPSPLSQASDRGLADQAPRLLYGRDCFVLCGVAFAGSRRWGAVGVDELPVVAAVGLHHHLEVGDSSRFLVASRLRSVVHHAA